MPELGNDNVTGDHYSLDLGIEPDLGNLLQNLQVANDMLDQVEQKFLTISDVVNTTTMRLSQATRQTELLNSETDRLSNSYQAIASSGATMGSVAAAAAGMQPGQIPYMPGQGAFGGYGGGGYGGMMPGGIPFMPGMPAQMSEGGTPFEGGPDLPEVIPPPPSEPMGGGIPMTMRLNQMQQFLAGYVKSKHIGKVPAETATEEAATAAPAAAAAEGGALSSAASMAKGAGMGSWISKFSGGPGGLEGLAMIGEKVAPYLAAFDIAKKGYQAWAQSNMEMTRYTGMTGGTGLTTGVGGGLLGLSANAWTQGILNPGVGVGNVRRIQDEVLSAGYTDGQYGQARDYMMEAYKRGLGETIDQLDVYEEAVDKAGATTTQLVSALDLMRVTARNTNASLTIMANNYKNVLERYTTMGFSGGTASALAAQASTAYAATGSTNPAVRSSAGLDFTQQGFLRAQVAGAIGVPYYALGTATYGNPELQGTLPARAEGEAIQFLNNMGFTEGMSTQDINDANRWGDLLGQYLGQLNLLPPDIDPDDLEDLYQWIYDTLNHRPQAAMAVSAKKAIKPEDFKTPYTPGGSGLTSPRSQAALYLRDTLGLGDDAADADHPLGGAYADYIAQNDQTLPIMDALFASGDENIANTYVRGEDGRSMKLQEYVRKYGMQDFGDGSLQFGTLTSSQQKGLQKGTYDLDNLKYMSEADYVAGGADKDSEPTRKEDAGVVSISDESIDRFARSLANELDVRGM